MAMAAFYDCFFPVRKPYFPVGPIQFFLFPDLLLFCVEISYLRFKINTRSIYYPPWYDAHDLKKSQKFSIMKTLKKQTWMMLLVTLMILAGCTNKSDDNATPDNTGSQISTGTWKVSNYIDSGEDETHKFNEYTFVFENNGSITATHSSGSQSGTWSKGNDDSQLKLYLTFGNVSPLDELNDDWHIIEQNATTIELEDVSGGNGGIDYLTFSSI
jgi:hypothetical protein